MSLKYNEQEIKALYYGDDEIVRRIINETVVYEKNKFRPNAFRFKNVSGKPNMLKMVKERDNNPTVVLQKSSDGIVYTSCDIYTGIELQSNETIYLRGTNGAFGTGAWDYNHFTSTENIECSGNVMDLCDGGKDTVEIKNEYQFVGLFRGMNNLLTAPDLPATTLEYHCYHSMFADCTSLVNVPDLPATTLAESCYQNMFRGCTSLKEAPKLPVTQLASKCYWDMFNGCTSLIVAPELPATILKPYCYYSMFKDCTSLTKAPDLPATRLNIYCYAHMFNNCFKLNYVKIATVVWETFNTEYWIGSVASSGTFVKPAVLQVGTGEGQIPENDVDGIPKGWKVVDI